MDYEAVSEIADRIAKAYRDEQIDSVYVIFNEFKSVISQRLIAQRILPVQELGRREVALAEEFTLEERERMGEAARKAGISLKEPEPTEFEAEAAKFATAPVDYIYEQSAGRDFCRPAAALRGLRNFPRHAGVGGGRECGPHDGDGFGDQQCQRRDRLA